MTLLLIFAIILLIIPFAWLDRQQDRLREILKQSKEAVVVINRHGIIKYANPATKIITGLKPAQIQHKSLHEVLNLHHLEDLPKIIRKQQQQLHTCETLTVGTGKIVHVEMFILPIKKNNRVSEAVVFLHNVTDRVRYENRLKKSLSMIKNQNTQLNDLKNKAEAASQAKDIFLANMSHELRTPLNGVMGALTLLRTTELTPDQEKYLELTDQPSKQLNRMISEVLDLTKMESGDFILHPNTFNPKNFLVNNTFPFQKQAEEKGLRFCVKHNFLPDEELTGDVIRLQQILYHLLSNAIKFTETGRIHCHMTRKNHELTIMIEDTGMGIEPDEAKIIFTKFTQVDSSSTKKFAGIGHGLYFVKKLVDLMKGTIKLEPTNIGGSRFTVVVPVMTTLPISETSE